MIKLSKKFIEKLDLYLLWSKCHTPFSGLSALEGLVLSVPSLVIDSISPEEWIYNWESFGKIDLGCSNPVKLKEYKRGKAMRDWWTKEVGNWKKLDCIFQPEEFIQFLMPDCFFELFNRYPITALVRQLYDNNYSIENFQEDMRLRSIGLDREQNGFRIIQ